MVTEKNNDVAHDFFSDPLTLKRDGNWLKATGTTLGADNGIGCAAALALLDMPATATLPPLEALFTVDEETGLTGAPNHVAAVVSLQVPLAFLSACWKAAI